MGARALPAALLGECGGAPAPLTATAGRSSERLRLENETLCGGRRSRRVRRRTSTTSSSASSTCSRSVSGCHACFVYLRGAATGCGYGRHRRSTPATSGASSSASTKGSRAGRCATARPRSSASARWTIRARTSSPSSRRSASSRWRRSRCRRAAATSLGVIVLHTAAPHEFDEGILNVLSQTASLIAGAIENAKLYEEAQQRVDRPDAAVVAEPADRRRHAARRPLPRRDHRHARAAAVRPLPAAGARPADRLVVVAADPPRATAIGACGETAEVLLEMLQSSPSETLRLRGVVGPCWAASAVAPAVRSRPGELLGALMVSAASRGTTTGTTCCARSPTRSRWRSRRPSSSRASPRRALRASSSRGWKRTASTSRTPVRGSWAWI